jgi:hypothetical protein
MILNQISGSGRDSRTFGNLNFFLARSNYFLYLFCEGLTQGKCVFEEVKSARYREKKVSPFVKQERSCSHSATPAGDCDSTNWKYRMVSSTESAAILS